MPKNGQTDPSIKRLKEMAEASPPKKPSFWKTYEWSKFLSREFIVSIGLMLIASIFVYVMIVKCKDGAMVDVLWWWTATVGGLATMWMTNLTFQKSNNLKANIEALKANKGRLPR